MKLMKIISSQIKATHRTPSTRNKKITSPKRVINKLLKNSYNGQDLETTEVPNNGCMDKEGVVDTLWNIIWP